MSSFYKKCNNFAREVQTRKADSAHSLKVIRFDRFFSRITGYKAPLLIRSKMLSGWVSIFPRKYEQFKQVRACWSHHKVTVISVPARVSTENANQPGLRTPTSMMQPWEGSAKAEDEKMIRLTFSHYVSPSWACCLPPLDKFIRNFAPSFPGFLV